MEITLQAQVRFKSQVCISCGVHFCIPSELDQKLRENRKDFYCPNGHSQHYVAETEADKLRRELKRKEQEVADQVHAKLRAQSELEKANKKLKRVTNGLCPCCNRSFINLARHMKVKHPESVKK